MSPLWFLRMSRWARNPPSTGKVKFVLAIVAVCFALLILERFVGWPDMLTVDRLRAPR